MSEKDTTQCIMIGSRIREVRISKGMSQSDLAEAANVSLPHISDIELGKVDMRLATFMRIAEALQVSSDTLFHPDVPEIKEIYQGEISELLEGLSPSDMTSIIKVIKEIKLLLLRKEQENNL